MQSLFEDGESFISDFLPAYITSTLELVDTIVYVPGVTDPPTTPPTRSPTTGPTAAPQGDAAAAGGGNSTAAPRNSTISEVNTTTPENLKNNRGIDAIYPALICGVVVFILTALWLAHRRHRVVDIVDADADEYSAPMEHISVDYDGRQEALDIAKQRQLEHMRTQEDLEQYQNEEIARRLRASRQENAWYNLAGNAVQSEKMEDGRTTIHISPETYGSEDYDYHDENLSEMTQVPALMNTSSSSTPLVMDMTMTSMSDESVYYDQAPNTGIFCAAGNNGLFGGSAPKSTIKYQRHTTIPNTNEIVESASMESI
jgi:hypothetical protein